jgi:hypothetical protein
MRNARRSNDMPQALMGTFSTGQSAVVGQSSGPIVIETGKTTARLTVTGLNGSNQVKTQKSTNNGQTWADQTTYSSAQTNVGVTVVAGEHWRLVTTAQQALRDIPYKFSMES